MNCARLPASNLGFAKGGASILESKVILEMKFSVAIPLLFKLLIEEFCLGAATALQVSDGNRRPRFGEWWRSSGRTHCEPNLCRIPETPFVNGPR